MIVHARICGYYDWVPCPPDVVPTQADRDALLVKQMADGEWQMRVTATPSVDQDCHGARIPELAICDRMAGLEQSGQGTSRAAVAAYLMGQSMRHHLDAQQHLVEMSVDDDGPCEAMYRTALEERGVTGPRADVAVASYLRKSDVGAYMSTVFQVDPSRRIA